MEQRNLYSREFKESLIAKVLTPNAPSIVELARQHNILPGTLYGWLFRMKKKQGNQTQSITAMRPKEHSLEFKLKAIFETGPMTDEEKSAYCRTHGLYPHHLEEWKTQILSEISNVTQKARSEVRQAQLEVQQAQSEKAQIEKDLNKDLNKKNRALAEMTALVVLQKKARLLWGDSEAV